MFQACRFEYICNLGFGTWNFRVAHIGGIVSVTLSLTSLSVAVSNYSYLLVPGLSSEPMPCMRRR